MVKLRLIKFGQFVMLSLVTSLNTSDIYNRASRFWYFTVVDKLVRIHVLAVLLTRIVK